MNGCASQIKYSNYPDDYKCTIPFEIVEVGRPNFNELPPEYISESTLNGRVRKAILQHNNKRILFIVDPEFPANEFDRWANDNLTARLNDIKVGDDFPLECGDYRRFTIRPNNNDGIYWQEID